MRALITGGKGFVGQWLAAHLKDRGDEVAVIDIETDVADGAAVRRVMADVAPEAVYHLAAMTHVGESWEQPEPGAARQRARHGGDPGGRPLAREQPPGPGRELGRGLRGRHPRAAAARRGHAQPRPASPYAASKLAAEAVALQAWRGFGQPVVVVRPFNHIGPGQSPNFFVPALAKRIVEARRSGARSLPVGTLTTRRDFTDVRDVVVAYRLLVERGDPGDGLQRLLGPGRGHVGGGRAAPRAGGGRPHARDRSRAGAAGRRARAAGECGAARGPPRAGSRAIPLATTLADVLTSWEAD